MSTLEEKTNRPRSAEERPLTPTSQNYYGEHHLPPPGQRSQDLVLVRINEETDADPQLSRPEEGRQPPSTLQNYYGEHHLPPPGQRSQDLVRVRINEETDADPQLSRHEEGRQPPSTLQHNSDVDQVIPAGQISGASVSTSQHYYTGPVSQYDLSNASNVTVSVGEERTKGCVSNETLNTRIQYLLDVLVDVHTIEKAKQLLKTYGHVTICGAPGDGKTSIALMLCEAFRSKNYQILFVENIEEFDLDIVSNLKNNLLIVFDDIFGSVTFSCNLAKTNKLFRALVDSMVNMNKDRKDTMGKKPNGKAMKDNVGAQSNNRLSVVFTSRTYNLIEGLSQLVLYKSNLFRPETILDLTREGLTSDERLKFISSFLKWSKMCDISQRDIQAITDLQNEVFGFPFICKLYFTTPAFQMHTLNFFQHPLTYLRGDLDLIVREGSSRSAALIFLVLCGGQLDLVSFQLQTETGRDTEELFLAVKEIFPTCTRTNIRKEINGFTGTYCRVEKQKASFSHPSIYDAAACAFGMLNVILLLKYCTLRFMFERVRLNRNLPMRPPEPDVVTNIIYINETLNSLVASRLVEGMRQRHFSLTINHPVLRDDDIASIVLQELMDMLPTLYLEKDRDTNMCFMTVVALSESNILFDRILNYVDVVLQKTSQGFMVTGDISERIIQALYEAAVSCAQNGKLVFLQGITSILNQSNKFDVDFRTKDNETLLMIASERSHLNVINFLLQEGAQVMLTECKGRNCLHYASESGSENITKVILNMFPVMINITDMDGNTPALICAKRGHLQLFQFLVSRGADLGITDVRGYSCLHWACKEGRLSIVEYAISLQMYEIDQKTPYDNQTPVKMAAKGGHLDVYNILVSEGADLSLTDKDNRDCLILACERGNVSNVKHLLSLKIFNINRRGGYSGQTPVMMAAEGGHLDVFKMLVSEGADLSLTDKDNRDCLMLACERGNVSIVKHLLSLKIFNINRRGGYSDQTPVMMAAERGHLDVFKMLVSEGADLSLADKYNRDCLMLACFGGNVSIVKHLLSLKIYNIIRRGGYSDQTPVMMAAERGHFNVYNILVSEGADLLLADIYNRDCLMLACGGGNVSIVKHLLSLKIFNINRRGGYSDQTPVMMAAEGGHLDVFNMLVLKGADLSLTDKNNRDCLMLACFGGNVSIVKHLLSLKIFYINRRGGYSVQTPVMMAAERGHLDVFKMLVSEGADLSLTEKYNRDCLMLACFGGNVSIVKHLLSLKIFNINRRGGYSDQTPVMMAAERGHFDVFKMLVSEGADLSLTDKDNRDCLILACERGNVSIVKHLLSLKIFNINRRGVYSDQTPVMMAAERGHFDVFKMLVSEGADLSLTDKNNRDCLMLACERGNVSIVKHLLSLKIFNINRRVGYSDQTPVMMAAEGGHLDVFKMLVSEGADLSLTDKYNIDCLMLACFGGNVSVVKHLLSLKIFNINRRGGYSDQTPVMMAAERGHFDVYNILVSEGADLSLADIYNRDCLMLACGGGNVSIVKYLLSLKIFNINRRGGYSDKTPVMMAAEGGHLDVFIMLVSEGTDLSLTDKNNRDCLMLACFGGNVSIVKHLLSLKIFNINRRGGYSDQTPVMMAAEGGHLDVYKMLVSEGADLSLTDKNNRDCLMLACFGGNVSIVKHLLSLKIFNINRRGVYSDQTPVMMAAERGHFDVFKMLVSEGADLSLTDKDNRDCLILACERGNVSIIKHLLSLKIFNINRRGVYSDQTPVMMAAERGHFDVFKRLVSEGADLSLTDKDNRDCLMLACERGNVSIVKHLLSLKIFNINRRVGYSDQTPVMMAAEGGHFDVFKMLVSEGADLSLTAEDNRDCLMLACFGGNVSVVKHLLSLKIFNINRRGGYSDQTPVMMAAERGHFDVYNILVSEGADLSLTDIYNRDCLMLACGGGNVSNVKHLLSMKIFNINRRGGYSDQTPVMMAAERGHLDVFNMLVSEGADLSLTDKYNRDCLMLACFRGNVSIVKHLLSLKIFNINRRGGYSDQTPVMMAAERGHFDVFKMLVSEGADLSLTDKDNRDCLMLACGGGNVSNVKHLLSLKIFNINRRGGYSDQTPVMMAAEGGHLDVFKMLVSEGADLSLTDKYNRDCLMLACERGNVSVVKHLLSLKIFNINRRGGYSDQTPVMMAAEGGHLDVFKMLVSEGADLSLTDKDNRDCLMLACERGNVSIVKHLLSLKIFNINRRGGYSDQTPVMMAAERGHLDVFKMLVSEGADLSLTDKDNRDCLMLACERGNVSIVKHLLSLKIFNINRRGGYSDQTLMAAERGHLDVFNILVSEAADLSTTPETV